MFDCREYERQKARLPCCLSSIEYERRIKETVDKLEKEKCYKALKQLCKHVKI